jgi:hypothetical protein
MGHSRVLLCDIPVVATPCSANISVRAATRTRTAHTAVTTHRPPSPIHTHMTTHDDTHDDTRHTAHSLATALFYFYFYLFIFIFVKAWRSIR